MNGLAPRRRRAAEFARLADLAVDRPGADVAKQLAKDDEAATLVTITQALRELDAAAGPDPEFRDRLRRRLVAHATVTAPAQAAAVASPKAVVPAPRGGRAQRLAKAGSPRLAFLAGTLAAMVLISGLTLLASSRAVPGDTLYAIKRSSEHLELALVRDPADRGRRQLSFAQERLQEIGTLVARTSGELGPGTSTTGAGTLGSADADRMLDVLSDMDRATGEGVVIITGLAVQQRSDSLLSQLGSFAASQHDTLAALRPRMPAAAAERAEGSLGLLNRVARRVTQLRPALNCGCMQSPVIDDLGPLPCTQQCTVPSANPGVSNPPAGPTSGPGSSSPDPVQTTPGGTSLPTGTGQAPPAAPTAGPTSGAGPAGVDTNHPLPTASGQPPPSPDLVCRLLDKVLCKH